MAELGVLNQDLGPQEPQKFELRLELEIPSGQFKMYGMLDSKPQCLYLLKLGEMMIMQPDQMAAQPVELPPDLRPS